MGDEQAVFYAFREVGEDCLEVLGGESGVVFQELGLGPALGEPLDDELDGDPRSLDGGFAAQDGGVRNDVVLPVHIQIIDIRARRVNALAPVLAGLPNKGG